MDPYGYQRSAGIAHGSASANQQYFHPYQHLQQPQQPQQATQQQQSYANSSGGTMGTGYGWNVPTPNASFSNSSNSKTFGLNSRFQKRGNGDSIKPPRSQPPNDRTGIGYGSKWVQPPLQSSLTPVGSSGFFPKKFNSNNGNIWAGPGQKKTAIKKPFDPTGKTPAMLLHELYKTVVEEYEEVGDVNPKRYKCIISLEGQLFCMEAVSKKAAKQKAAELAIHSLRPDIVLDPFVDATTVENVVPLSKLSVKKEENDLVIRRPTSAIVQLTGDGAPPVKKTKLSAVDSACSLLDLMRKLCLERTSEGTYNPEFSYIDTTEPDANTPENMLKRKYRVSLKFSDQGKVYENEGIGKNTPKEFVIRQALVDLFKISDNEIRSVIRRHVMGKLSDMQIVPTLYHVALMSNCDVYLKVDISDEKGMIGSNNSTYFAVCKLTDKSKPSPNNESTITSPPCNSKHMAKEWVAGEMLKTYFDIDPSATPVDKALLKTHVIPPCHKLHLLLTKTNRQQKPVNAKYEELEPESTGKAHAPVFKCKCIVDDKHEFIGSGSSKKAAKNKAALIALKEIFKFDYDETVGNDPNLALMTCSKRCFEIAEYAKREYYSMCNYYVVRPSTNVAAFFLLNDKDEKRLLSVASSGPGIADYSSVSTAKGTSVIHMDPIVLARRSLLRYLMLEMSRESDDSCIFEKAEDGRLRLKSHLRLVLYSVYPPNCLYSCEEAKQKSLALQSPEGIQAVGDMAAPTLEEMSEKKEIRVHCAADKVFKWMNLGVQGGLLSTLLQPIIPQLIYFGSQCQVDDSSLAYALCGRFGKKPENVEVEANQVSVPLNTSTTHLWTRDMDHVEVLNRENGKSDKGNLSRVCKASIYQEYLKLTKDASLASSYLEAKDKAIAYQADKKTFYKNLAESNWGKWQKKPAKLVDFHLESLDV